jgi:peroxiredoxin Q/BCP
MASRVQQKQEAREARLRTQATARAHRAHLRSARRGGYVAVAFIAAALIAFAALSHSGSPAAQVASMGAATSGPAIGAQAPAFSLTNAVDGKVVSSASLRGHKTLLFFSEGVGCQACMVQAADLQKDSALSKAGIKLVSITTDPPAQLAAAATQYGLTAPMLADPTTSTSSGYGMLGHGGMQHPTQDGHAFMLLDANGKVLWHQAYSSMYVPPSQLMTDMMAAAPGAMS